MPQRHASYWEAGLTPNPPARELPARVDVLIVGAGFMGRWLALFLGRARPAPSVLVVERDHFGYGASSRNAGFLTSGGITEMLADSRDLGFEAVMDMFERRRQGAAILRAECPEMALDHCGSMDFDPVTDEKRDFATRLNQAAGIAAFEICDATLGGTTQPAFRNRGDSGLNPVHLLNQLQGNARGVTYAFGTAVARIGGGVAACTCNGRPAEVRYRRAFLCTNAFAGELEAASPVVPGRGQVVVTSPAKTKTTQTLGYLNGGYDYFRFVDGRLLLGGGRDKFREPETTTALDATAALREYLERLAGRVLGHADFRIEHHWAGVMGFIGGKHLGGSPRRRIDAVTEAVAGFGGMGVALTPITAREIADEL